MKTLILILSLLIVIPCYGQKIDSIAILHPETRQFLQMIYTPKKLGKTLDKQNKIYKTNLFIVLYYYDDDIVIGRRMRKNEEPLTL